MIIFNGLRLPPTPKQTVAMVSLVSVVSLVSLVSPCFRLRRLSSQKLPGFIICIFASVRAVQVYRVQVYRCIGVYVYRCMAVKVYRCLGIQVYRCIQVYYRYVIGILQVYYRYTKGILQVYRCIQVYRCTCAYSKSCKTYVLLKGFDGFESPGGPEFNESEMNLRWI